MEISFAIRQISNIRDLYEYGQKIATWLPQFEEQTGRIMESRPAKEVRFIIFHDIDSAAAVFNAGSCPAWSDMNKGLIHLCPDPIEWRKVLQEETEYLQADNNAAIRLERFYRMWTMRYIATVFIGQGIAWRYQPFQILNGFAALRWLYRGLALHVGRQLWEICEPYVPDETEQFVQLAAEGIKTIGEEWTLQQLAPLPPSSRLQPALQPWLPPPTLFSDLMAAAAAAELTARSGGIPQLCVRLTSALPQCHPHADLRSLLQALGLYDEATLEVLKRFKIKTTIV
ncbi:MAG TPA: hypothetical protein DHD79_12605 [Firmicutes bacterium]|nr:hypothetical protein [Bacillota bacterium]HAW71850.1 hypothetical protein [Bacillota bacterium]HAZ23032.1 hypothetical protein [Bacillota bacterium]HBE07306.1 hypothetical protein [Bacillota bacterium]HBG43664.1 hypothetical protein [Bacillota bacterium]